MYENSRKMIRGWREGEYEQKEEEHMQDEDLRYERAIKQAGHAEYMQYERAAALTQGYRQERDQMMMAQQGRALEQSAQHIRELRQKMPPPTSTIQESNVQFWQDLLYTTELPSLRPDTLT